MNISAMFTNKKKELEKIVESCINKQDLDGFHWTLNKLGRNPTMKELVAVAGKRDGMAMYFFAPASTAMAIEHPDELINLFLEKGWIWDACVVAENAGASKATIKRLLGVLEDKGDEGLSWSCTIASLLGDELGETEKRSLVAKCVATGDLSLAKRAKELLGEDLIGDNLEVILRKAIASGDEISMRNVCALMSRAPTEEEIDLFITSWLKAQGNVVVGYQGCDICWLTFPLGVARGEYGARASKRIFDRLATYTLETIAKASIFTIREILIKVNLEYLTPDQSEEIKKSLYDRAVDQMVNAEMERDIDGILSVLKELEIELSADAIEKLIVVARRVKSSTYSDIVGRIARMGASQATIERLVLSDELFYRDWIAKMSIDALEKLLKQHITRADLRGIDEVLRVFGRDLILDEIISLRKALLGKASR